MEDPENARSDIDYEEKQQGNSPSNALAPSASASQEDIVLSGLSERLNSGSIKEATEWVELYGKAYDIIDARRDKEHKRQIELQQNFLSETDQHNKHELELKRQDQSEKEHEDKYALELRKQKEVEKEAADKLALEARKQQEIERENTHKRNLETREMDYKWGLTYLSFLVGILLIISGFGAAGSIIVGGALSIPTGSYIKDKLRKKSGDTKD